jgi:hypothetical protein
MADSDAYEQLIQLIKILRVSSELSAGQMVESDIRSIYLANGHI